MKRCGNIALGCTRASPSVLLYNPEEKPHCSVFDLPPSWLSKAPVTFSKLQGSAGILTASIPGISVLGEWRSPELDPLRFLSYRLLLLRWEKTLLSPWGCRDFCKVFNSTPPEQILFCVQVESPRAEWTRMSAASFPSATAAAAWISDQCQTL